MTQNFINIKKVPKILETYSGYAWRDVDLTKKEVETLKLIEKGMSNKEIADFFGRARLVIARRSGKIRRLLRFESRQELVKALRTDKFSKHVNMEFKDENTQKI